MFENWQKYSFAEWLPDGGAYHLFPDSFVERIHRFLQPYTKHAKMPVDYTGPWDHPDTIATEVDWETSKKQTRSVLERISPDYADIFDHDFAKNQIFVTEVVAGRGAGRCLPKGIEYERDGTINDVIYLTHEFGHRIWALCGNLEQPASISEWQAFFMQHAAYHTLIVNKEWGDDIAPVIATHQKEEINQILGLFSDRLRVLGQLQEGKISEEEKLGAEHYAIGLHKHTPAIFIGLALFNQYRGASPADKERMRDSLFKTTADTTPDSILENFGLGDNGKLEHAMRQSLQDIGITAPTSKPAIKHDKV